MDEYDRREFLSLSLPSFLGVLTPLPSLCTLATRANAAEGRLPADGAMHWEAFLEAVAKEAGKQHLDAWNQDDYVGKIAKLASRLHLEDPVLTEGLAQLVDIFTPPYNDEREEQSRWFKLAPNPIEGHKDIFEAEVS